MASAAQRSIQSPLNSEPRSLASSSIPITPLGRQRLSISLSASPTPSELSRQASHVHAFPSIPSIADDLNDSGDSDDEPSSTARLIQSDQTALVSQLSRESLTRRPRHWSGIDDDEEDEDEELWGTDTGRGAAGPDERVLPRRTPSLNAMSLPPVSFRNEQNPLGPSQSALAFHGGATNSPINGVHSSMSPTEEWRSKILESVRKGEEKVAQRRKESMASLDGLSILASGTQSGSTSSKPRLQTVLDDSTHLDSVSGPCNTSDWSNNQKFQDIALTSDRKGKRPDKNQSSSPSHLSEPSGTTPAQGTSSATESTESSRTILTSTSTPASQPLGPNDHFFLGSLDFGDTDIHSHLDLNLKGPKIAQSEASLSITSLDNQCTDQAQLSLQNNRMKEPLRASQTRSSGLNRSNSSSGTETGLRSYSTSNLARSNSTLARVNNLANLDHTNLADERRRSTHLSSDNLSELPPTLSDGTFLSVANPTEFPARSVSNSSSNFPEGGAVSTQRNNLSTSRRPIESSNSSIVRKVQNSPSRSKSGKRNFFSSLLQRASGAGSLSTPTSPGPSSFPLGSRSPFDSPFARPSTAPIPDVVGNSNGSEHDQVMSQMASDNPNVPGQRSPRIDHMVNVFATPSTLSELGLTLTPMTPLLPIPRNSQPLCGAILDNKYLLIGTNNGLDFVPMAHLIRQQADLSKMGVNNMIGTVKPMNLIKKTRFKSLKVLEVRSNILLAIAGRNDHLRVYALDGIRAIIAKKIQDLEDRADFHWIPRLPGMAESAGPSKGKRRATDLKTNLQTSSPRYSPPPPYRNGSSFAKFQPSSNLYHPSDTINPNADFQPPVASSLRRSSTVGSGTSKVLKTVLPSSANRRSSFHSSSGAPSAAPQLSSLSQGSPLTSAPSVPHHFGNTPSDEDNLLPIVGPLELGLEREVEEEDIGSTQQVTVTSELGIQDEYASRQQHSHRSSSSNSAEVDRIRPSLNSSLTESGIVHGFDNVKNEGKLYDAKGVAESEQSIQANQPTSPAALLEVIKARKNRTENSTVSHPNSNTAADDDIGRFRLVPRSPLAADPDEIGGSTDSQLHLADVLQQRPANVADKSHLESTPLTISVSAPLDQQTGPISNSNSRFDLCVGAAQPILPRRSGSQSEICEQRQSSSLHPASVSDSTQAQAPSNHGNLSPGASRTRSGRPSTSSSVVSPTAIPNSTGRSGSRQSSEQESGSGSLVVPKTKKRWSVMDSVFRTHSANFSNALSSNSPFGNSLSRGGQEESSSSHSRIAGAVSSDVSLTNGGQNLDQPPMLRIRSSMQKLRIGESGPRTEGRSSSNDSSNMRAGLSNSTYQNTGASSSNDNQPRERLATHFHGQSNHENPKTSPHPATLGAPLEYVKLARTKGAKLLRAVETRRRTYLAVLCGESSERIELFTGSKNISLSLNRTFVLPETPRTIEFQMQGDDLVDIYLVYDESVFALEPATVRVREVGISRNERRAARRERERAARDLASINMRPSVTSLDERYDRGIHGLAGNLNLTSGSASVIARSLSETLGLFNQRAGPPSTDEGLSLATITPSNQSNSSYRPAPPGSMAGTNAISSVPPNSISSNNLVGNESIGNSLNPLGKVQNLWPYTTFQQLQFIPPLPPSVLASTFLIPPTYESVLSARGKPEASDSTTPVSHSISAGTSSAEIDTSETVNFPVTLELPSDGFLTRQDCNGSSGTGAESNSGALPGNMFPVSVNLEDSTSRTLNDDNPETASNDLVLDSSRTGVVIDGPLLEPISLLSAPAHRHIGPPGLFLVTRGRKVTSIVDCDGRSVMKKPFIWTNDRNSKPLAHPTEQHGFRIEVIVVEQRRTMLVGIGSSEVKAFEVGGENRAKGLEEFSNSQAVEIVPQSIHGGSNAQGSSSANTSALSTVKIGGGNGVGVITSESLKALRKEENDNANSASVGFGGRGSYGGTSRSLGNSPISGILNGSSNLGLLSPNLNSSQFVWNREVTFLASCHSTNEVIWCEKVGNSFAIYTLSSPKTS